MQVAVVIYPCKQRTASRCIEVLKFEWKPRDYRMSRANIYPRRNSKSSLHGSIRILFTLTPMHTFQSCDILLYFYVSVVLRSNCEELTKITYLNHSRIVCRLFTQVGNLEHKFPDALRGLNPVCSQPGLASSPLHPRTSGREKRQQSLFLPHARGKHAPILEL